MHLPTYWLSLAMAVVSLASLALAWRISRLPAFPGRLSFALSMLAVVWWSATVAIEHGSSLPESKVFWAEIAWIGIVPTPGYWALFIWDYINGQRRATPRFVYWLPLAAGVAICAVALTNAHHHLMYAQTIPTGTPPAMMINYIHGPFFFVVMFSFYALMLLAELALLAEVVRSSPLYRTHYLGLGAASLIPWIINIGYATKTITIGTADPTTFGFLAMNLILYWLVSQRQLFDLLPIAQDILLDAVPDPVLVLDAAGRITESNPAAQRLLGAEPLEGRALDALPALKDALGPLDTLAAGATREVSIGDPARYFDLGQEILSYGGRAVGRLILLRDITHRKALQQQLREEAIRDALTGLHNRRFFTEIGPVLLAEAQRQGTPLAAAMIDLDHFKRLNDTHGHAAGDAVLRATGAFLKDSVRQSDLVFRLGGEEFLILLPRTAADQALRRVDEWRAAFAAKTIDFEGATLTATFSAGVAAFPDDAAAIDALLSHADQALYRAKTGGRNRTEG
ncbi:MAG TPA: diguanylate cyclase [Magnetospirillaceae bacterium]|jgi:diguanylate cyclase (GGDEF)-like protein